jgi:hypothetical protein
MSRLHGIPRGPLDPLFSEFDNQTELGLIIKSFDNHYFGDI